LIYEGEWKFDKRHGNGFLVTIDGGLIYEGQWDCDNF